MKKITAFFIVLCTALIVNAQDYISISDSEVMYIQDFNSLDATRGKKDNVWNNGIEPLVGWHAYYKADREDEFPPTTYYYSAPNGEDFPSGAFGMASFGIDGEMSLGSRITTSTQNLTFGVKIKNEATKPIKSLLITYSGIQWTVSSPCAQYLTVSYKLNATTIADKEGYIGVPALEFSTPTMSDPQSEDANKTVHIDGYDYSNRIEGISYNLKVNIPVGEYIWIRWYDFNDPNTSTDPYSPCKSTGTDAQIAIDDLSIIAELDENLSTDIAHHSPVNIYSDGVNLNVSSTLKMNTINIYDNLGKVVFNGPIQSQNTKISIGDFPSGAYITKVILSDGSESIKRFIK